MELYELTATEIVKGIKQKHFSAEEVVKSCLSRINKLEDKINALTYIAEKEALKQAQEIDSKISKGEDPGPLAGVPVIIKDNICTKGIPTTCGSKILKGWIPPYDATVIKLLKEAGAVILAKANMDEFAMGSSTEYSAFGPTKNPWDLSRVPGGSSGGSAAAVAAGYAPIALGSDTGGSIRQPANFCGVYGLKPTYGAVSRYGLVAFASSLDQIGPFTRSAEDMALIMSVISKYDLRDSTSLPDERPDYLQAIKSPQLAGKKIGLVKEALNWNIDPEIVEKGCAFADKCAEKHGTILTEISLPNLDYALSCYYIIAPAEASSNLARYDGVQYGLSHKEAKTLQELYLKTRGEGFGPEVKRRIMIGTFVLSSGYYDAYYLTAQKVRTLIKQDFERAFEQVDVIFMPVAPTLPFKIGEKTQDPITMYLSDIFTIPINLAGICSVSLLTGYTEENIPVGIQVVGPWMKEATLLEFTAMSEQNVGRPRIAPGGEK